MLTCDKEVHIIHNVGREQHCPQQCVNRLPHRPRPAPHMWRRQRLIDVRRRRLTRWLSALFTLVMYPVDHDSFQMHLDSSTAVTAHRKKIWTRPQITKPHSIEYSIGPINLHRACGTHDWLHDELHGVHSHAGAGTEQCWT